VDLLEFETIPVPLVEAEKAIAVTKQAVNFSWGKGLKPERATTSCLIVEAQSIRA
jgi:hypothetical protein